VLPANSLLTLQPLYSGRQQTFYTPETLFLSIGIGQQRQAQDNSIATLLHEGVHWRQFQGTTFGAFCQWLKHAQAADTYHHLRNLSKGRKRELLSARAAGIPILSLDDRTNLPTPPLSSAALKDPVNLLRSVWYDYLFTYRFFRNSCDIEFKRDPPADIFASAIADAATILTELHPSWAGIQYSDVQDFYTFERVGKVGSSKRELGTKDLLEAAAVANELFFKALFQERRYLLTAEAADEALRHPSATPEPLQRFLFGTTGVEPISTTFARERFDRELFRKAALEVLSSSYGYALRMFFQMCGMSPDRHEHWGTAVAVIDFALNGPLPPLVLPGRTRPEWCDIYPPARFMKAATAVRKIRTLVFGDDDILSDDALRRFFNDLAGTAGLTNPMDYSWDGAFAANELDFNAIKQSPVWDELATKPITYYDFLRWCQRSLLTARRLHLALAVAPIFLSWLLLRTGKQAYDTSFFMSNQLGFTSPIIFAADGEIEHNIGSTPQFGTWLALSTLIHHTHFEIMTGSGKPDFAGFPPSLFRNEDFMSMLDLTIRKAMDIDFDPWQPSRSAATASAS
jgi:hypothetical protein